MKKVKITASGCVQGVGFRWATLALANSYEGLYGRVWNNDDGTVTILAQAEDSAQLHQFIQAVRKGPNRFAKVNYLEVCPASFKDYKDFQVLQTAP